MAECKAFKVVLPCESWSEFPSSLSGRQADELLAAWCLPWHPALLSAAKKLPAWHSAADPPEANDAGVALVPSIGREPLPSGWLASSHAPRKLVMDNGQPPEALMQQALDAAGAGIVAVDPELIADFRALGFCYLHVQLLNHQMHYASHLDEGHFEQRLIHAADACLQGDRDKATSGLTGLFDLLMEARDHFYPVDTYLVELVLVAPTTLDRTLTHTLDEALNSRQPMNLLMEASLIERLADCHPEALDKLRQAWEESAVEVVGGHHREEDTSLLPLEVFLRDLLRGRSTYQRYLGSAPAIYARRKHGLHCAVPQIIGQCGFVGGLTSRFDAGQTPYPEQCRTRWESSDGHGIDCLASSPLDAADPGTYLGLARSLGESIERDFVATLLLAHWPHRETHWHQLLKRVARFGPVLGKFITLKDYFESTDPPGIVSKFKADQFATPYTVSSTRQRPSDPISQHVVAYRQHIAAEAIAALDAMAQWARRQAAEPPDGSASTRGRPTATVPQQPVPPDRRAAADAVGRAAAELADQLVVTDTAPAEHRVAGGASGRLVLNPLTHSWLVRVDFAGTVETGTGQRDHGQLALIDTPGLGFAWADTVRAQRADPPVRRLRGDAPVAESHLLRNEFFEVRIHPRTGGIQAIWDYAKRGNLISQQLAYRYAQPPARTGEAVAGQPADNRYSRMVADSIETTSVDRTRGEIVSRGTLRDADDRALARFEQTVRVQRGRRVLQVDVSLTPDVQPDGLPWENYYAVRLAWADVDAEIYRGVSGCRRPTERTRWESPEWWEIVSGPTRVTVFPLGMPFHQRSGPRMADVLVAPAGESCRMFRFGIGIGVEHPHHTALQLATADLPLVLPATCPAGGSAGWLICVDRPNTIITHCEVLWDDGVDQAQRAAAGFRLRLLETEGRSGAVRLDSFRPVQHAIKTDFVGHSLGNLSIDDGGVQLVMTPYEWTQIEARWQ